jgi:hypothetical protein
MVSDPPGQLLRDQVLSNPPEDGDRATILAKPLELTFPIGARARRNAMVRAMMISIFGTEREEPGSSFDLPPTTNIVAEALRRFYLTLVLFRILKLAKHNEGYQIEY